MGVKSTMQGGHDDSIVFDGHNDSLVAHIRRGALSLHPGRHDDHPFAEQGEASEAGGGPVNVAPVDVGLGPVDVGPGLIRLLRDPIDPASPVQLNLPKMRAGGIDVAFFAVDVTRARNNHLAYAMEAYGFLDRQAARLGAPVIATTSAEIRAAKAAGTPAAVLALENSDGLEGSLDILGALYRLGVRAVGLTHNPRSRAADGVGEEGSRGGLTAFGRALVRAMNACGMLVDVAHLSGRGFWDVVDLATQPFMASHMCCRALCDHPRNLSDEQLRALAQAGGVAGITFVPEFVAADRPTLARLIDHVEHAVQVAGVDAVGLGSDFDGGGTLIEDATQYGRIAEMLGARGFSGADIAKVMGGNFMRLFAAVCG